MSDIWARVKSKTWPRSLDDVIEGEARKALFTFWTWTQISHTFSIQMRYFVYPATK